jgi:hypothetical protein
MVKNSLQNLISTILSLFHLSSNDGGWGERGNLALSGVHWVDTAKLTGNLAVSIEISIFRAKLPVWEH